MIDWSILNIEETTNEETITNAYRKMLTVTNPEDNPEGFMLLRTTYEEALKYARTSGDLGNGIKPVGNIPEINSMASFNNYHSYMPMENTNDTVNDFNSNLSNNTIESSLDKTQYIDSIKELIKKRSKGDIQETMKLDIPLINQRLNQNNDVNNIENSGFMDGIKNEISDNGSQNNIDEFTNKANAEYFSSDNSINSIQATNFKEELKPIEIWIENVKAVYNNFEQRISINAWQELLKDEVCVGLDTRMDATDAILTFLMKHYNLPQQIWILLDKTFGFKENKKELLEKYPKEFIENVVISSIEYPDIINYDLFVTGLMIDYDQFICMYFDLVRMMRQGDMQGAYDMIIQLDTFGSVHPYVEVERIKYYINMGQLAIASQNAMLLYQQYPEDIAIIYIKAEISWAYGNIHEAKSYYEKLLSINKEHYYARIGLADCYMQENDFEKAKDMYTMLMDINPYDSYVSENLELANNQLIEIFEKKTKESPSDIRIRAKLAWCYLQKKDVNKAIAIANEIANLGDLYESSNILGRCYLNKKDSKNAIIHLEKWVECIRNVPRNGNIENKAKYSRLGQAFELLGQAYEMSGKEKKALSLYKLAVKEEPSNIGHKVNLARYQLEMRKYENCIDTCAQIIKEDSRNFNAIYYRAVSNFKTDHLAKALEDFEECLSIYQYDISSYVYKIRILIKYCEYDKVNAIFDYLDKLGLGSDAVTFYKTKMRYEKEIIEESKTGSDEEFDYSYYLDTYENLLSNYKNDKSDIDDPMPLYIEMANLYIYTEDYKQSLTVLKNVHDKDKNNVEVYECLAVSFEHLGEIKAAIESYKRILTLCPDHREANVKMAKLLEKEEDYTEAIKCYSKQLEITKSIQGLLSRGAVYLKIDDFKMARKDFKEAVKMNPYNPNSYNYLGVTYLYEDNYQEALKAFEKAVERIEQEPTPLPYRNLAITYIKLGDIDKAVECYEKNIQQFNESYDYEQIAVLMYEQKRYKESVEAYTKKTKLDDNECSNIELYIWVGKCNTGLESENTALKYYTKAIKEAKMIGLKSNKGYIQVAKMYMELGKYEMAIKFFKQINRRSLMTEENLLDYAYCCMNGKSFSEAQNVIKYAMERIEKISDKDIANLARKNYLLSYAYWVQGNYAKANEHLDKLFNSRKCENCKYSKCHKALAIKALILEKTGDDKNAISTMEEALKITPGISRYIHEYNRIRDKFKH